MSDGRPDADRSAPSVSSRLSESPGIASVMVTVWRPSIPASGDRFLVQKLHAADGSLLTWSVNSPRLVVGLGRSVLGMIPGRGVVELFKTIMPR